MGKVLQPRAWADRMAVNQLPLFVVVVKTSTARHEIEGGAKNAPDAINKALSQLNIQGDIQVSARRKA